MRLAVVQSSPRLGAVESNLEAIRAAIEGIAFDLLVLPELFATGYFFNDKLQVRQLSEQITGGPTTHFLTETAKSRKVFVCAGLIERDNNNFYNSAVLVGPQGLIGRYRKLHLFYEEKLWFTPGEEPPMVYDLGTAQVGMMICFDWRFPEVARILALQGAQVIMHPANLVQPHCQDAMVTRCLENGVFIVTSNRIGTEFKPDGSRMTFTGRSQVVNPRGDILAQATEKDVAVITAEINPAEADDKLVTEHNHLLNDRRPAYYSLLAADKKEVTHKRK